MLVAFYIIWSDFQLEPWLEMHYFARFAYDYYTTIKELISMVETELKN